MSDYAATRHRMVENQLRPNRVADPRVLAAMGEIPRELFVPKPLRGVAYADEDLRLPDGRYLIEPMVLGRMLQAAAITRDEVVLIAACGSGYSAAVASRLAGTVFLIEPDADRAARLEGVYDELDSSNVVVVAEGDPASGHLSQAPFDVVLLPGRVGEVPRALLDQLGDGGRLVALIDDGRVGKGTIWSRVGSALGHKVLFDASTPPLPGIRVTPGFVF